MAVALVAHAVVAGPNGGTTAGIDTTGATLLIVHVSENATGGTTVSDNKGNTWTPLTAQSANSPDAQFFYVANPTVGTGHTFTASGASTFATLDVAAFSGVTTTTPFDQENGTSGAAFTSGVNSQPGSITPGVDGELIVAGIAGFPAVVSIDSGFTILDQTAFAGGNNFAGAMAYLIQTSAAAVNPMWTWTGGSFGGALTIASFKAGAGGAAGVASPAPSIAGAGPGGVFGPLAFQWRQLFGTGTDVSADIAVFASCSVGVAAMAFDSHDVTAVASGQAAAGGTGVVTRDIASTASEQVAVAPRGTVTIDYGSSVAGGQVAVGGVATAGHDIIASGAASAGVAETATIAHGVTAVGSEGVAVAISATVATGLTATASEQVAAGLAATVTRDLTGLATEGIAVGGTATTSGLSDVSVFARAGTAAGGAGTITTGLTAVASESVATGGTATVTTGVAATARLDAATSISAGILLGLALTAIARAATGGTATVTIQTVLPLPPLVPPFAAIIDAYKTSTVSTTPDTSTVNTTPVGVT